MSAVFEEEENYFDEDKQLAEIEKLTDEEEIKATKELIKEDLEKAESGETENKETDNSQKSEEPGKTSDKEKENSEDVQKEPEKKEEEKVETPVEFTVTDEFIEKQPEENKALFTSFKGKKKEDLAKATANAIAMKNPLMKGDEAVIAALEKKLLTQTEEDIVKNFVETQKTAGKKEEAPVVESPKAEKKEIELPQLEDSPEVKKVLQSETYKRLKRAYPEMPDDPESQEFKDWKRDQADDDPEFGYKFGREREQALDKVTKDLRTTVYVKENWRTINNQTLEKEVELIKKELKSYGIEEAEAKELGLDLTLTKDDNGSYFNPIVNSLVMNGNDVDTSLIKEIPLSKDEVIPLLKSVKTSDGKTLFLKKFMYDNNLKIMNYLMKKNQNQEEVERVIVKDQALNTVGADKTQGGGLPKIVTAEQLEKMTDDAQIAKSKEDIRNSILNIAK